MTGWRKFFGADFSTTLRTAWRGVEVAASIMYREVVCLSGSISNENGNAIAVVSGLEEVTFLLKRENERA